ncbi:MAG: MATE family multidrug resistance protein [Candidatus Azotimanducaceae bacterium]|jgi:MATE family multidrug resistance protein
MHATTIKRSQVLHIAWPIILSNLSIPLLGLVDTAVIGNLGDASLLGAIAVGAVIFSFIYWGFGFLRMGTTALVAQAVGGNQQKEASAVFYRAAIIGAAIGLILITVQIPIAAAAFGLLSGSTAVEEAAQAYFTIRIMGAPFSLALLAVMGYLLGVQATRTVLLLNIILNGLNIILDLIFVLGFGWGVEGVALATVLAEITALSAGFVVIWPRLRAAGVVPAKVILRASELKRMLVVNRDIMIRTLCLIFAFAWFTNQGASQGDIILATNAILMQFVTFAAFFLDGFALAAETLIGAAVGARNHNRMNQSIRYVFELGAGTALVLSGLFWLSGGWLIDLLTNVEAVREASRTFLWWAVLAPVISVWCYLLDGIFIGATRTPEMRNAMIVSLLAYLGLWWVAVPPFGNHGLWLALHGYFIARALSLAYYLPRIMRQLH